MTPSNCWQNLGTLLRAHHGEDIMRHIKFDDLNASFYSVIKLEEDLSRNRQEQS